MKDLSLHLMDIIENSINARATEIRIDILESKAGDYYRLRIRDNGSGMSSEMVDKATDPWTTTRTTRKIGMGLPLLQQNCNQCGGFLRIFSVPEKGCILEAEFSYSHLDRPPAGDIPKTLKLLIGSHPETRFIYTHYTDDGYYSLDTREVETSFEGNALQEPVVLRFIQDMIRENLFHIKAS